MALPAIAPRKEGWYCTGMRRCLCLTLYQKRVKETLRHISMGTWGRMPKVAHRMPTFDIEERLLANPTIVKFVVDVGIRYAEHETINLHHGIPIGKEESQKWHEAELVISKLMATLPTGFSINHVELMLARSLQMQGEYLSSTQIYSKILGTKFDPTMNYSDEAYVAIEYLTLALTYAKQAKVRATIYYKRGRAQFCLGDCNAAEDYYRRGRNSNQETKPANTLASLKLHKAKFYTLASKPIREIIACVRKGMGEAAASLILQRSFRQFLKKKQDENPQLHTHRLLFIKQKATKLLQTPPISKRLLTEEKLESKAKDDIMLQRLETLASLKLLNNSYVQPKPYLNVHPQQYKAPAQIPKATPVNFLAPDFDRPDYRRKRSMASYRRLGYSNSDISYIQHWHALLQVGFKIISYPTASELSRYIVHVQTFHTSISRAIAICALVHSDGNEAEACGKLTDAQYYTELQSLVQVINVENMASARWNTSPLSPLLDSINGTDEILHGVPEIDPATGRFIVQDVREAITPARSEKKDSDEPSPSRKKVASSECKRGSFRPLHIINDQVAQDSSTKDVLSLFSLK
ncbi:hypothetical protein THRCLA_04846 [Thraustotheca clavata]|uniref:Uncharacterized protein n=1 Tax=Thraustotheca clavata TaxID=74557 RepID=A0A1V9ZXV1_9STRA|nr:hypothetical protein THRCLA_04846 [Thraustotheca clavata]